MELKLAQNDLDSKPKNITFEDIVSKVEANGSVALYLDKSNAQKDIQKMLSNLEKHGKSVHLNELKFGLDKDSFLYEMHIINY